MNRHFFPAGKALTILLVLMSTVYPSLSRGEEPTAIQSRKDSMLRHIASLEGKEKLTGYRKLADFVFVNENPMDSVDKYYRLYGALAREQGDLVGQGSSLLSPVGAMYNRRLYADVVERGLEVRPFLYENQLWGQYYECCVHIINTMYFQGQGDEAQREARKVYEEARDNDRLVGVSCMLRVMGDLYVRSGLIAQAEECYRESLETEKRIGGLTDQRLYAYSALASILTTGSNFDGAESIMKEWEAYHAEWEADRTEKGLASSSVWGWNLWQRYMALYYAKGDWDKAWEYCEKLGGLKQDSEMLREVVVKYRMLIQLERGDYADAYRWNREYYEMASHRGNTADANEALRFKAILLAYMDDPAATDAAIEDLYFTLEKTHAESANAQLNELRTIYEVDKLEAQKRARENYLWLSGGIIALLGVLLAGWIVYSRRIRRKNLSLYAQLREAVQNREKSEQVLSAIPEEQLSREMQLFRRVNELVKNEKLFTDPSLNRKALADAAGTNETYIAEAIREATGLTVAAYIAELRLRYSLELLADDPSLTLEAIAADSGHGSYSAFFRTFTRQYGITPSEYRRLSMAKKPE